jgi:lipoate synthase
MFKFYQVFSGVHVKISFYQKNLIELKHYMNPTKNLIEANLYMNPTKNLIELKHYMNPTKNLIEANLYMNPTEFMYSLGSIRFLVELM